MGLGMHLAVEGHFGMTKLVHRGGFVGYRYEWASWRLEGVDRVSESGQEW